MNCAPELPRLLNTDSFETLPSSSGWRTTCRSYLLAIKTHLFMPYSGGNAHLPSHLCSFLIEAISSCENKAEVVISDEKEAGVRATLNLG